MQVTSQYPVKCLLELLVSQGIAERVDRAIGVAEEVGEIEEMMINAASRI